VVEQIPVSSEDCQTPSDHLRTSDILHGLNLPEPPRGTVAEVPGNGVLGAVGEGCVALLSGHDVAKVKEAGQIRQGVGSGSKRELGGGCLSAVAGDLAHRSEPLCVSVL